MTNESTDAEDGSPDAEPLEAGPVIHTSEELFQGRKEAWIEHDGQMYRLRVTSKGNLILTK